MGTAPDNAAATTWRDALVLGAVALLVGGLVVLELADWPGVDLSLRPGTDMHAYLTNANGFLSGTWPGNVPYYRAPLYSYILALLAVFGRTLTGAGLLQAVLFAGAVVLTYWAGRLAAGRVAGWVAGLGLLGYGGAVYFVTVLHSTVLEIFCGALTLALVARLRVSWRRAPAVGRGTWLLAAGAGLAYAALCLVRPNFLIVSPVFALGMVLEGGRARWRQAVGLVVVFAVASAVPVFAAVIRNNRHSDKLVFMTTNAAVTWKNSNSHGSRVLNYTEPDGAPMRLTEGAFWAHQARKAAAYWWNVEPAQNVNFYLFREASFMLKLLAVPFGLITAAFLLAHVLLWGRLREFWPYLAFFWIYCLTVVAFFVIGRFRLPMVPAMLVVGAAGVVELARWWRTRRRQALAMLVLGVALCVATMPGRELIRARSLYNVALCSMEAGRPDLAVGYLARILPRGAGRDDLRLYCVALAINGKPGEALPVLDVLQQHEPDNVDYALARANILRQLGRPASPIPADRAHYAGGEGYDFVVAGVLYFQRLIANRPLEVLTDPAAWDWRQRL